MATYNQMQVQQKPKFSVAITTKGYQSLISNTLRNPARARRFTASITSAVAINPALQECDAGTILAGALLGESLNLSPSPQLGQYYLVPFKQKAKYDRSGRMIRPESVTATFVLGYKGYLQLALRSGQYRELDVMEIKEGEYLGKDSTTGKAKFQFIEDDDQRDALPTVGYMAYFEYLNGFRKALYWSKEKMMTHADTYSKAFSRKSYEDLMAGKVPESEMWKYSSFWYKNFDDMAKKTLLRQLTFSIDKVLRTKIENILLKMISFWQQFFFRDLMENGKLRNFGVPVPDVPDSNSQRDSQQDTKQDAPQDDPDDEPSEDSAEDDTEE